MGFVIGGIMPHPPLLIPEIGGRDRRAIHKTIAAMESICRTFAASGAEMLIIITPHGPVFRDSLAVMGDEILQGDFRNFGAREVHITFRTDLNALELLKEEARLAGIGLTVLTGRENRTGTALDHGATVPLYYLHREGVELPGLHITFGLLPPERLFEFGRVLRRTADRRGVPAAFLASGDLSHRLIQGAPGGYDPRGAQFDRLLVRLLSGYRVEDILTLDPGLVEAAGECGLRSIIIALGFFDGTPVIPEILSYEGPFGVGYLVASFTPGQPEAKEKEKSPPAMAELARKSVEYYLAHKRLMPVPSRLPPELTQRKGGVFVSIKNAEDESLRGCIGTVEPCRGTLAEEIIHNAVDAAFRDPRFEPMAPRELGEVVFSVDVLSEPEKVDDPTGLDPQIDGVIVQSDRRRGLLLPAIQGVDRVEDQLEISLSKAGIAPNEPYEIYRFTVERYKEKQVRD